MLIQLLCTLQYCIYNTALRQFPALKYAHMCDVRNVYSTTIHVLVSAVQKLARSIKLPDGLKLYRGLSSAIDLPDGFYKSDACGCRGFVEWGFMSTTADKAVAIQYSALKEGQPFGIVLEISVGSVARGACIKEFSQYPQEEEHLWIPCSFLEPNGNRVLEVTPKGVVSIIPVSVTVNPKARTVEEIEGQKRQLHINAFRYLLLEVRKDLVEISVKANAEDRLGRDGSTTWDKGRYTGTVHDFISQINLECQDRLRAHEDIGPSGFVSDEVYRSLVVEMLDVKAAALSKLRWWLEDESCALTMIHEMPLRECHSGYISFLERTIQLCDHSKAQIVATKICKLKGLFQRTPAELNEIGEPPLVSAAGHGGSGSYIQLLLWAQADIEARDEMGLSALAKAARFGQLDCLKALLSLKATVGSQDKVRMPYQV
jgi:hypothetical protein